MALSPLDTDQLIQRVGQGDDAAGDQLLARHRGRLRQMVAIRLDRRVAARVDPSDVVQEVLTEAAGKLKVYAVQRPLPFFPWLRQMAWQRLIKIHEQHIHARKRTTLREQPWDQALPDESAMQLARQLVAPGTSPSRQAVRNELHRRVRAALDRLGSRDREVLVLRYLEQLSVKEIAVVLEISESAVKTRHFRALHRLRNLLGDDFFGEGRP